MTEHNVGWLVLTGWHGTTKHAVDVIGSTRKKYRIQLLEDLRMPGKRYMGKGSVTLVPHHAVRDNCTVCHGTKGGAPGNENVINGIVVCDYCHAALLQDVTP